MQNKNNYCEICKFQFKDRPSFMLHIQQTHKNDKQPLPQEVGRPQTIHTMPEEKVLAFYLKGCQGTRERYGCIKENGIVSIQDHEVFNRLDFYQKDLLKKAIEVANRNSK